MDSAAPTPSATAPQGLLVQIASYNTNLQGNRGLPQDLVDWLSPTLLVSSFLSRAAVAPDIVTVGFQELLPLHLGFTGLSANVMNSRHLLIQTQIEAFAPNKERYVLIERAVYVGVALLVYARDDTVARRVCDVQKQWTGCGPMYMGNKGAVGVRFRVRGEKGAADEIFTFVNAHLTAHAHKAAHRVRDWKHLVSTLLFPSPAGLATVYDTSHLFVSGDLNFRLHVPPTYQVDGKFLGAPGAAGNAMLAEHLKTEDGRAQLKEFDELLIGRRRGELCQGLREGDFWRFKCSYKFAHNEVDAYALGRTPSWTDRVMFTTHADKPETPEVSAIQPVIYTTIPSYVLSDHKPLVALLALPPPVPASAGTPMLHRPPQAVRDPWYMVKRWIGKTTGWTVGWIWCVVWLLGAGRSALGTVNLVVGVGALSWWRRS